ncbi:Global nitrogen regulator [bacterium HR29]|jgi:CRP-like cAMP-binding protein|nr:Global nitrogen regulator [bacterium HR29]
MTTPTPPSRTRRKEALQRSIAWYLRQLSKVLSVLSDEELERLIPLLTERRFRAREVLFAAGQPPERVFLVLKGRVKLFHIAENGKEVIVDVVGRGGLVGDHSIVENGERIASAQALEDTVCLAISWEDFLHVLQQSPRLGLAMVELMARRLAVLQRALTAIVSKPVAARLADFLFERAEGSVIRLGLTHQEIANSIGTTRETVTALLSRFVGMGAIAPEPGGYRLIDRSLLEDIAAGVVHVSPRHPPQSNPRPAAT